MDINGRNGLGAKIYAELICPLLSIIVHYRPLRFGN